MAEPEKSTVRSRWRRPFVLAALGALVLWFLFFDSHSLAKRVSWNHEQARLSAENAALRAEIDRLEARLEAGISDAVIEQIAREQYGMRRPGETVYRVEPAEDVEN